MGIKHIKHDEIDSTQSWLKENISEELGANVLVSTLKQTSGVGRLGNQWSQFGKSLAFSFSIEPTDPLTLTPLEIGVLIVEFFKTKKINLKLKWPNDILIKKNGEYLKVGGILCNFHNKNQLIVGIGLNLDPKAIPKDSKFKLKPAAISNELIQDESFYHSLPYEILEFILNNRSDQKGIKSKWNESCCHLNKKVSIRDNSNEANGIFSGISDSGEALLDQQGNVKNVVSGSLWILE